MLRLIPPKHFDCAIMKKEGIENFESLGFVLLST